MRALLVLLVLCGSAVAHPLDTAYLRVEVERQTLAITFDIDVALAAQELKVEIGAVDPLLTPRGGELAAKLYRKAAPRAGDAPCAWGTWTASRKGSTVTFFDTATCPAGDLRWDLSFGKQLASTFQILGKVTDGTGEHVIAIDKSNTELAIAGAAGATLAQSLRAAIEHVGLLPGGWHPIPAGLECLLLALLLLLGGGGMRGQLTRAWMLIVGHAIGVSIASAIPIPPMAAAVLAMLAIAGVTGSLVTGKLERQRWLLAGIAGGAHGAATLAGVHPIGFAAGFAIAQLAIAIVIGPLLAMVTAREELAKRVVPAAAIALGLGAIYGVVRWL